MPDFREIILPRLAKPAAELTLQDELILPNYVGFGLANLPASISAWLGGPQLPTPGFDELILSHFQRRYKRVVLIVVDALGYSHLLKMAANTRSPFLEKSVEEGMLFPITSISPSTTATALTTLWTGCEPGAHGIIGYEMWVNSLSMVINTILHTPTSFVGETGSLAKAGFEPSTFLGKEPLGKAFGSAGIQSHAFMPSGIGNSGLSQMHLGGTVLHGYTAESDLWANMLDTLNAHPDKTKYVYAYWSSLDTLIHRYGTNDERVSNQFAQFVWGLDHIFLNGIDKRLRAETLVLLTADHGSIPTPDVPGFDLHSHPLLNKALVMQPTNENRLPFFYIKPGIEGFVRDYVSETWPNQFSLITREEAFAINLFGVQAMHPDLPNRVGDLIGIAHDQAYLWWANKTNMLRGRHGGLRADEMLIPLLSFPLE